MTQLRKTLERVADASEAKGKKKKLKTAGLIGDWFGKMLEKSPGKKQKKKIDDILNQDPYAVPPPEKQESASG